MTLHIDVAMSADAASAVSLLARQLDEHGIPLAREALTEAVGAILGDASKGTILLARKDGASVGVTGDVEQRSSDRDDPARCCLPSSPRAAADRALALGSRRRRGRSIGAAMHYVGRCASCCCRAA
jgi:hypothetical protein